MKIIIPEEEFYKQTFESLTKGREREGNKFDNIMFAVTVGSLTLSVTAVLNIVKENEIFLVWTIITSWIFLIISIALIILGYFIVQKDFDIRLEKLNIFKEDTKNGYDPSNNWQKLVNPINKISYLLWFIGILFMSIFFCYNLISMNNKNIPNNKIPTDNKQISGKAYSNPTSNYPKEETKVITPIYKEQNQYKSTTTEITDTKK